MKKELILGALGTIAMFAPLTMNVYAEEKPSINNYRIENVDESGFDFIIKFNSNQGVTGLHLPYWKEGNYDNMISTDENIKKIGVNEFKIRINMMDIGSGTEYVRIGIHPKINNNSYFICDLLIKLDTVAPTVEENHNKEWTNKDVKINLKASDNMNIIEQFNFYNKNGSFNRWESAFSKPKILLIDMGECLSKKVLQSKNYDVTVKKYTDISSVSQLTSYDIVLYDGYFWSVDERISNILNEAFEKGVSIISNANDFPNNISVSKPDSIGIDGRYTFKSYTTQQNGQMGRLNRFATYMDNISEGDGSYQKIKKGDKTFIISEVTHAKDGTTTPGILMKTHLNGNKWIHFQSAMKHAETDSLFRAIDEIMYGKKKTRQVYNNDFTVSENGTYKVEAVDFDGNIAPKNIQITNIDKISPQMNIEGNSQSWTNKINLNIKATDNLSGIKEIILPNGNIVKDSKATFNIVKNGNYTFKTIDNAGNEYAKTITIDKLDTSINDITGLKWNMINNNTLKFDFNGIIDNQSGLKGYSYVIDKKPNTIPDNNINTNNTSITKNIDGKDVYYIHLKAIDNAGNTSNIIHSKIDIPNLTTKPVNDKNYIRLDWNMNDIKNKTFKVYQQKEGSTTFNPIGATDYNNKKQVKVLNIYPYNIGKSVPDYALTKGTDTFDTWDGEHLTLPKSASLKKWMEEPNGENPKGYGKGLIEVTPIKLDEFNKNPNSILKNLDGSYKYDVIMFGTWDSNGEEHFNQASLDAITPFLDSGRGLLLGHDSLYYYPGDLPSPEFRKRLNISNEYERKMVGSTTVRLKKSNSLTAIPWHIGNEGTVLNMPYSHTVGLMPLKENVFAEYSGVTSFEKDNRTNNYYLTANNNIAQIQTGHSNGQATSDEQKIIANTLFYLNQLSENNYLDDYTGQDVKAPDKPNIYEHKFSNDGYLTFKFNPANDNGSKYKYYVESKDRDNNITVSNTSEAIVTTGVKGYSYVIDDKPNTVPDDVIEQSDNKDIKCKISNKGRFIHIKTIDNAGNSSETLHYKIEDNVKPSLNITGNPTEWTKESVVLKIKATDNTGIDTITLPNGNSVKGNDATFTVTSNGQYQFKAVDLVGNETISIINVTKIDKEAPTINYKKIISSDKLSAKLEFEVNDTGCGLDYIISPEGNKITSSKFQYPINDNGLYLFEAYDKLGNKKVISIDVEELSENIYNSSGIDKIEYKLSGATNTNWIEYKAPFKITNEGVTTITARCYDKAGNISSEQTSTAKIDKTRPINNSIEIILR